MKSIIAAITVLLLNVNAYSTNWIDYKDKTYLGGYYAAVCNMCISGRYNNDGGRLWHCADDRAVTIQPVYQKGCAKAVWDAFIAKYPKN